MFAQLGASKITENFEIQIATARNVFLSTDNYFLEVFDFDSPTLVVTFESAGAPLRRPEGYRIGWGARQLRRVGISNLSVKPKQVDWYRKPDLAAAFALLREQGLFSKFERVVTYGSSMGGFAALAYADAVEASTVLALNPQTTLNRDKVPWETRFKLATREDWTSPFSDAAEGFSEVTRAYVVVDRMFKEDWGHVARLPQDRLTILNFPFVGHEIPTHLQSLGLLAPLLHHVLNDTLSPQWFAEEVRSRRKLKRYFNVLERQPTVVSRDVVRQIVTQHRAASDQLGID